MDDLYILILTLATVFGTSSGFNSTPYVAPNVNLVNDLLENYDRSVKPEASPEDQLTVSIRFDLIRLEGLDSKDMVLSVFGSLSMVWTDRMLQWDPADYNGFNSFVINSNRVWLPDLVLMNAVEDGNGLHISEDARVTVGANGYAFTTAAVKLKTSCEINLFYFPFDSQICQILISSWSYNALAMNITSPADEIPYHDAVVNNEWNMVGTRIFRVEPVYDNIPFATLVFQFHLKRKPLYLALNLVLPAMLLSVLSLLVFCLPAASGEKISLGITVQLSFTVLLLMMSDITPRSSDTLPLLSIYMIVCMALSALSLFAAVFVINLHHHATDDPVPACWRSWFTCCLATILCMKKPNKKDMENGESATAVTDQTKSSMAPAISTLPNSDTSGSPTTDCKNEWESVAHMIDRLFLCIFSITILVLSVGCLVMIITSPDVDGSRLYWSPN